MENPIDTYIEAMRENEHGDKEKAAHLLAQALGGEDTTPAIAGSVDRLLDRHALAHQVTLGLLAFEANKRRLQDA